MCVRTHVHTYTHKLKTKSLKLNLYPLTFYSETSEYEEWRQNSKNNNA